MAEDTTISSAQGTTSATAGTSGIAGITTTTAIPVGVIVPEEAKTKYPDLVELILQSESMNTEERNYWLQVLPVMTPDQIAELRDILETEKKKLAAIDAKYAPQAQETPVIDPAEIEAKRKQARRERQKAEQSHSEEDAAKEQELLAQLSEL